MALQTSSIATAAQHILDALNSLPAQALQSFDQSVLQASLNGLVAAVDPYVVPLTSLERQNLLTNVTWIAEHIDQLSSVLNNLPADVLQRTLPSDLIQLVVAGSERASIMTVASPDLWSIVYVFITVICLKFGYWCLLFWSRQERHRLSFTEDPENPISLSSTFGPPFPKEPKSPMFPIVKTRPTDQIFHVPVRPNHKRTPTRRFASRAAVDDAQLAVKAKAILAHLWNAITATTILSLQVNSSPFVWLPSPIGIG